MRMQVYRFDSLKMRGMTLIDLMIASTIGLVMIAGVLKLFMNAQEAAAYLNSASRVQESGRFANNHIARTLRMTGYDDPTTTDITPVSPFIEGGSGEDYTMAGATLKADTDVVMIRHEGAPQVRDCRGVEVQSDVWVSNVYGVSIDDELVCSTLTRAIVCVDSTCTESEVTANASIIAEGIENMAILYGADIDADGTANRYVAAIDVTDWTQVVSAKVMLLVNSVEPVFANSLHSCESCDSFDVEPNNFQRGEFQTTIYFRNH